MSSFIQLFQFPVSAMLGVVFVLAVFLLRKYLQENLIIKAFAGWKAGIMVMSAIGIMMTVEGIWGISLHLTVPFFVAVLALQLCLELAILERIRNWKKSSAFIFAHAGMFIIVWSAFWGAPDTIEANIQVYSAGEQNVAYTQEMKSVPLPFSIKLEEFKIDYHEDGTSPKQFTSKLIVRDLVSGSTTSATEAGRSTCLSTSVNHPCRYKRYMIYQEAYDMEHAAYSILRVVRNPWLPLTYLGMLLLAIGSALMLSGSWKKKVLIPAVMILAAIFTIASTAEIKFGTLPPALRSLWFVPHLIAYMVAYSAMAISVLLAIISLFAKSKSTLRKLSDQLLRTTSVLLILGMLCGSVWAQQAWGNYWAWDPKECWAAVTWLLTLVCLHLKPIEKKHYGVIIGFLILSFLSIQITWYGVNHLPSSTESMHTYNK